MKTKDMTMGRPGRLIFGFALPLMLGNIFQQLYTFADTLIVGQALGVDALAALGATEWMNFLMFGSILGLVQGFSVIVAQCFGAGDMQSIRKSIVNAAYLTIAAALLFTAIGQMISQPVLIILRTPNEIIGMSQSYLRILYAGVPITLAYNLLAAILRALGNSKAPLQAMTIGAICNIILDALFIFIFGWGIRGAAFATLLAQMLSAVFCLVNLRGIEILKFNKSDYAFDRKLCSSQLKLGLPMWLQNVITAGGGLIVQSVINGFGVLFIAAFTAANKLYGLLEIAASSYGYAMLTYAGQNIGAGLPDRVRKGLRAANWIGVVTALCMSAIMMLFGKFILGCFITGDAAMVAETIKTGYQFLIILSIFFPLLYILYITRACIQGLGNTVLPMVSSIAQLVMRTACALILPRFIGYTGIFYGEIFAWIGADIILWWFYFYYVNKLKKAKCRESIV